MKHCFPAVLLALAGLCFPAPAQVKSADSILKDIQVEGRVSFPEKSLPFKLDSTDLATAEAKLQLTEIAKALRSQKAAKTQFRIIGHTCDLGGGGHNLELSKRRAAAIKSLLVAQGVAGERLSTDGLGESVPAVPNTSDANRRQNRRVVIAAVEK